MKMVTCSDKGCSIKALGGAHGQPRRDRWLAIKGSALLLALALALAGCGQDDAPRTSLTMVTQAIKTLDSTHARDGASFGVIANTQETLMTYKRNIPVLAAAKSYEVSQDGKTYTFYLREGMKWSDGAPLTSKDFLYAWRRLLDPDTASSYASLLFVVKNAKKYYLQGAKEDKGAKETSIDDTKSPTTKELGAGVVVDSNIAEASLGLADRLELADIEARKIAASQQGGLSIEDVGLSAPSSLVFKVELENPVPYLIELAAFPVLAPLREDAIKKYGASYGAKEDSVIYSGPYVVSSWKKGSKLTLVKNKQYFDAENIKVPTIKLVEIKEFSTQYQMFLSGEIDVLTGHTGEYISRLKAGARAGHFGGKSVDAPSVYYIGFNFSNPLFQSRKIRLALGYSTHKDSLVKKIIQSDIPAYGLVPRDISIGGVINYREKVHEPLLGMEVEKPKELFIAGLEELGADTNLMHYSLRLLMPNNTAEIRTQGEFIKSRWEQELGIHIELILAANLADFLHKEKAGDYDLIYTDWGADYNSPLTFLSLFATDDGNNTGHYSNIEVDALLNEAQNSNSLPRRLALYARAERILLVDDPALMPIAYRVKNLFYKSYVKGLELVLFGGRYQLRFLRIHEGMPEPSDKKIGTIKSPIGVM